MSHLRMIGTAFLAWILCEKDVNDYKKTSKEHDLRYYCSYFYAIFGRIMLVIGVGMILGLVFSIGNS